MKRACSILLASLFLVTSIGVTISISSCTMNKKAQAHVSTHACCQSNTDAGCCKNATITIKLSGDYLSAAATQVAQVHLVQTGCLPSGNFSGVTCGHDATLLIAATLHSPPPLSGSDYCVLHSIFLI